MTAYADLLRKQKEQHTENAEARMNEAVKKYRKALQEEAEKLNKGAQESYANYRPSSETSASASRGAYLNRMAAVNAAQNKASGALGAYGNYYSALYQGRSADTDAVITNIEKKDQEAQDAIATYQQAVRKAKSRSYRKTTSKSSGETAQITNGGQTTSNGSTTHVSSSGVTHGGSSGKLNLPTTGKNTAYQAKLSTSSLSSKLKAGEITQAKTPSAVNPVTKTTTTKTTTTQKSELATARSNLIKSLTLSALAGDSRTPDMVTAAVSAQTEYQKALDDQNQKIADAKKNLEAYKKPQRHPDTNTPFASQDDTAYNVKVIQNYLDAKAAWTDPNEIKLLTSNINNILSSDVYMTPEQRAGYMATVEELRRQEKDQVNAVDLWNQTAKAVKLDAGTASLLDTYNDAYDKRSYYNNYQDPGEAETEWDKSDATMAEIRDAFMREGYTEEQFEALAEMRRQKTNAEKQKARNELNAAYAEKYPILATLISTPASLISGSGLVDMGVDNALGYAETFAPNLDVNSEYFRMANFAATEREAVSKDMGKFAKFMYDVGTSGLDSLAAAAISSGIPGFGEFLLGSGAAVQEMMDVTSRGGTAEQAVTAGMAAGAFESIFEHISIENLEALKEMPVRTAKDWVLNMLKSAVTNFEEEAATEVADLVSEYLIAGDVSEAAQTYQYYLSSGMSEQEASKQTAMDLAEQVLMSGVSGAVMGIGFGAMSGVNAFRGNTAETLTPEQAREAVAEAFSGTDILNNVTEQIRDMAPSQASPVLSEAADQMHAATEASIAEVERLMAAQDARNWTRKYGEYIENNPTIDFTDKRFVFSGFNANQAVVEQVIGKGGQYRTKVSGLTNYLVIDPKYAGQSKVIAAIEQREKGKDIKIIHIDDLEKALRGETVQQAQVSTDTAAQTPAAEQTVPAQAAETQDNGPVIEEIQVEETPQQQWADEPVKEEAAARMSGKTAHGINVDQSVLPKIDYNKALSEGTQRSYVNKNAYTPVQKARTALVDKDASLYDYRKKHSDSLLYEKKALANSKTAIIASAIGGQAGNRTTGMQLNAQLEPVGESLATIINGVKNDSSLDGKGMDLMQDYLYNKLNIERAAQEKAFTGDAPTDEMRAADSERIVKNIEAQYPAIKDHAAKVRKFLDNNLQYMVDTGNVSAELADKFRRMYPDYLPVMINDEGDVGVNLRDYTDQLDKQLVKTAEGGNVNLLRWDKAIERHTRSVYSQGINNQILNEVVAAAMNDPEWARTNVKILAVIPDGNTQTARQLVESNNSGGDNVYAAINGDSAVVFGASDYLNTAIRTLAAKSKFRFDTNTDSNVANVLGEVGNYFVEGGYMRSLNSLVTTYQPSFFTKNPIRDFGDMLQNSPHLKETLEAYPTAWAEVFSNSEGYQRFVAIMSNDILTPGTKANVADAKLKEISQATELVTRYAEYLGGLKTYGDTYEGRVKALYDAKEVTINFGRSGYLVQKANQYAFRFLNAGVQGMDKMVRNITERRNTGALTLYMLRAAALGAAPLILNAIRWHDDDDFEQLTDSMKAKNLYLFKTTEGKFIGIPMGRTNSAISRAMVYAVNVLSGKENISYSGFSSMFSDIWDNVGIDVGSSFILSPIINAMRNKTWYGGDIDSEYEKGNKPASEIFDSSTDYLSRWIGKQTGWSPKRINYVLDQYGGVLFDYTFPLFTPETMGQSAYEIVMGPLIKGFTTDPVYSNVIGSNFTAKYDDATQNKNSLNPPAGSDLVYKYMKAQKTAANELYVEIDNINNFRDLPEEKQKALIDTYGDLSTYKNRKEVIRGLRITINGIKKNAVEQYDVIKAKAAEYSDYDPTEGYLRLNHDLFGAEYALKYYSMEDYAYAVTGAQGGMDYETYYQYMLNTTGIYADKDKNGRSISGSKKQKYIDYINGLDIPLGEKAFLLAREYPSLSNAYTPGLDSKKWKRALFDYINSMDISSEEKKTILVQYDCFEVDSKGNVKIR